MKARTLVPVLALGLATLLISPILAEDLPLVMLYKKLAEKNYYPALEGLKDAQADVKSNLLDHLVAVFPDAAGKPIAVKFYWSKASPEAVPKQKFVFIGPENLSGKWRQRWQITPDVVVSAPIYETMKITNATTEAGKVTVTALPKNPSETKRIILEIDASNWQVRKETDFGEAQTVVEMTTKDLGGKGG